MAAIVVAAVAATALMISGQSAGAQQVNQTNGQSVNSSTSTVTQNSSRSVQRVQQSSGDASQQVSQTINQSQSATGVTRPGRGPVPNLKWGKCPRGTLLPGERKQGYQCATVEVPLDYDKPNGKTIDLALGRLPAENQRNKIGTLFFNPGGPGASGRIPPEITPRLHKRFDIVGFDPRGVGASNPVKCFNSPQQAISTLGQPFPINQAQRQRVFAATERGTELCDRNAGRIISHMSTANVARDMNLLRQAVGDEKLSYIGFSYGTHLGEVYANLFPNKVRAMTLDAVLDPVEWTTGEGPGAGKEPFTKRVGSFEGAQNALQTFFGECAADERCAFSRNGKQDVERLQEKYDSLLRTLRQGPIEISTPGGDTSKVTYQQFVGTNLSLLYSAEAAPFLSDSLQQLYEASQPSFQRRGAPPVVDVPDVPTRPTYQQPLPQRGYLGVEWLNAVSCLDSENPSRQNAWPPAARQADATAPGFGSLWTYASLACATWPAEDEDRYAGPWNRETSNPILLVGNSEGDPATPYGDAQTTADRLADARLLTLDSYGHTATGGLSSCIDRNVERYLIGGKLPPKGKVCQPDREPFDPVQQPLKRMEGLPR